MARRLRDALGGVVYHVVNRGSRKGILFRKREDYIAFEHLMSDARAMRPMRIIAYCLLSNHWHFLLWPANDGDLSRYMHWLTTTHADTWRRRSHTRGEGAVYQARFFALPIVDQLHYFSAWRYIERNPVTAKLVARAEEWPWSSASYINGSPRYLELDAGPHPRPADWMRVVNGTPDWDIDYVPDMETDDKGLTLVPGSEH